MQAARALAAKAAALCVCASTSQAIPQAEPVHSFRELEDNDLCPLAQVIDANVAVAAAGEAARDCFFIVGKLQRDLIWDIQPKCAVRAYDKPQPSRDELGRVIPGRYCEPIIASGNDGRLYGLAPLSDGTIRLGLAALMDAFDGTINGLSQNGLHHEMGEVTLKIYFDGAGQFAGEPDEKYVFRFTTGGDALRLSYVVPAGVASVDVMCCDDTGTVGICWDVDHYEVRRLDAGKPYCVTVVGGLNDDCEFTDTLLGWFDKDCFQIGGQDGVDDDDGTDVYSDMCVFSDGVGTLRFAVSGKGDANFNGLLDESEYDYFDFLFITNVLEHTSYEFRTGASAGDDSAPFVNRYPREFWDEQSWAAGEPIEARYAHGVCGQYTIKIRPAEHNPDGSGGSGGEDDGGDTVIGPDDADLNGDGLVNASDLALMLSFWGSTQ